MKQSTIKRSALTLALCVSILLGIFSTVSANVAADEYGGDGTGCYYGIIVTCPAGGQQFVCQFNGLYGAPYTCADINCLGGSNQRPICVQPPY